MANTPALDCLLWLRYPCCSFQLNKAIRSALTRAILDYKYPTVRVIHPLTPLYFSSPLFPPNISSTPLLSLASTVLCLCSLISCVFSTFTSLASLTAFIFYCSAFMTSPTHFVRFAKEFNYSSNQERDINECGFKTRVNAYCLFPVLRNHIFGIEQKRTTFLLTSRE